MRTTSGRRSRSGDGSHPPTQLGSLLQGLRAFGVVPGLRGLPVLVAHRQAGRVLMDSFQPIAPRPSPVRTQGAVPWVRRNLFGDPVSAAVTLLLFGALVWWLPGIVDWAALKAVFAPDADRCQAARGIGACWGVVTEKHRLI